MNQFYQKRIEQLQTADMVARVRLIGDLIDEGYKAAQISRDAKLPAATVRHCARVHRKLVPSVMDLFQRGKITFSLARTIASLPAKIQESKARNAIAKHTSVHRFRGSEMGNKDKRLVADLERLANDYSERSGLDIQIKADAKNPHAGTWLIRYCDLDMFDRLVERIVGHETEF